MNNTKEGQGGLSFVLGFWGIIFFLGIVSSFVEAALGFGFVSAG